MKTEYRGFWVTTRAAVEGGAWVAHFEVTCVAPSGDGEAIVRGSSGSTTFAHAKDAHADAMTAGKSAVDTHIQMSRSA